MADHHPTPTQDTTETAPTERTPLKHAPPEKWKQLVSFGVYGETLLFNVSTMFFCFVFGVNFGVIVFVFTTTPKGGVGVFQVINCFDGLLCTLCAVGLFLFRFTTVHYRHLTLLASFTNLALSVAMMTAESISSFQALTTPQQLATFAIILAMTSFIPTLNYTTFFNLSFSLSSQHATCYIIGMAFNKLLTSVLNQPFIPNTVHMSVLTLLAFLSFVFTLIVFFVFPKHRVYYLLKSQKRFGSTILSMTHKEYFAYLRHEIQKKAFPILTLALINLYKEGIVGFNLNFLMPRITGVWFIFDNEQNNGQLFFFTSLFNSLLYAGDVIGRCLGFIPYVPSAQTLFVVTSSLCSLGILFGFPLFTVIAVSQHVQYAQVVGYIIAPFLGIVIGFVFRSAMENILEDVELRIAVTILITSYNIGDTLGFVFHAIAQLVFEHADPWWMYAPELSPLFTPPPP